MESSGKSTLAAAIQAKYGGLLVHEYARTYCEKKIDFIHKEDVIHIGDQQLIEYQNVKEADGLVIFDTNILTTIIWLKDKFHTRLQRFHNALQSQQFDLIFLCAPDLPWEDDGIREDGHRLKILHERYIVYLKKYDFSYILIEGLDTDRENLAFKELDLIILTK